MRCANFTAVIAMTLLILLGLCNIVLAYVYSCDGLSIWLAVWGLVLQIFYGSVGLFAALIAFNVNASDKDDILWFLVIVSAINSIFGLLSSVVLAFLWQECVTTALPLYVMVCVTVGLPMVLMFAQMISLFIDQYRAERITHS